MGAVKSKWNWLLPLVFVALFAVSRIPNLMPLNFSAAYAFAFCSGIYFSKRFAWWLPMAVLILTDLGLNLYYWHHGVKVWDPADLKNLAFNYLAYAVLILLGRGFKPRSPFWLLLSGGLVGATLFYLITNTASWFFNPFHNPEYTRNLAGWLEALTKGAAGFPSTLQFFKHTLLSGGAFTALFVGAAKLTAAAESPAEKTAGAKDEDEEASGEEAAA